MAEYIEREMAFNAILKLAPKVDDDGYCWVIRGDVARAIDSVPAADVAPVRHGKWVEVRELLCTPGGDPVWECSECGRGRHVYGIEHGTYGSGVADGQWAACPNCGADMRGE